MDSSDRAETPPATTDIQTSAPMPSIPLAPLPQPPAMAEDTFLHRRAWMDGLLAVLVIVFAFLIASFPAFNSDFFRQAALGRMIVKGDYTFGADPLSFTAEDVYFENHSWLFAVLASALYQIPSVGDVVVVIFKALLMAVLAAILLRVGRRAGRSSWIPAVCTALAVLAASPRMLLHSTCLSFLFLGLTLWLLQRGERGRSWWWLPPLFALWSNCDAWFILGLLTVVLFLVGDLVQRWLPSPVEHGEQERRPKLTTLGLVLLIALAACFVNPHHIHSFSSLPPELGLSPANDLLRGEDQFDTLYLSPLDAEYYQLYFTGRSVAGMSYWLLLAASLLSFVCLLGRASAWRVLIWLGFALLSLYNARCIPFFAIVAGPLMALNWLDFAGGTGVSPVSGSDDSPRLTTGGLAWSLGGRALSLVAVLVLMLLTVPGWLQNQPYDFRRLGWRVVADPSLRQMAEQINAWHQNGQLAKGAHCFNMRQGSGDYLAWFAPDADVRVYLDQQLPYSRKAAEDYLAIRDNLAKMIDDGKSAKRESPDRAKKKWETILRDYGIQYWILDRAGLKKPADMAAWLALLSNPKEWVLCSVQGRATVFAWKDPQRKNESDPSRGLEMNLNRLAFGADAEQAPPRGATLTIPPRDPWHQWLQAAPPTSPERYTAAFYDLRFQFTEQSERMRRIYENRLVWRAAVASGAIGTSLLHSPVPNSLLALSWSSTYHDVFPPGRLQPARPTQAGEQAAMLAMGRYVDSQSILPPASLYLSVRAARRALRDNPQDPQTHLLLGKTYIQFDALAHERSLKQAVALAADIRWTQMAAAFSNCLRLQPRSSVAAEAHEALFQRFDQLHYQDAATHHLREWINERRKLGAKPNESATQFAQTLDRMDRELKRREEKLRKDLERYELSAEGKSALTKFSLAMKSGLAETALTALEQLQGGDLNGPKERAMIREVRVLLLNLGRLDQAREVLMPDLEAVADKPMPPMYLDLHLRLAAANGDYEQADRLLADALNYAWKDASGHSLHFPERVRIDAAIASVLLGEAQHLAGTPQLPLPVWIASTPSDYTRRRWRLDALVGALAVGQQRGEWHLLRGWLALECGRCVEARGHFQDVLDTLTPVSRWRPEVERQKALLEGEIRALQELAARQTVVESVARQYLEWLKAAVEPKAAHERNR